MEYAFRISIFSIGDMEGEIRGSSFKVQIWCSAQGISSCWCVRLLLWQKSYRFLWTMRQIDLVPKTSYSLYSISLPRKRNLLFKYKFQEGFPSFSHSQIILQTTVAGRASRVIPRGASERTGVSCFWAAPATGSCMTDKRLSPSEEVSCCV